MRIGIGNDIHRLVPGDGLVIGGVKVACDLKAEAHSDGDALLHALTDALLGAIGGGDIGELFSDTAVENKGRASADFVNEALRRVEARGRKIGNIDAIVMLQAPKLSPYKQQIRENLAALCGCDIDLVNVKAKTGERIGPVGEGVAIAANVVVLLAPDEGEA